MSKKKTIVEQYELISKMLNGEAVEDYTIEQATAFLAERSAQTAKKNAGSKNADRKPTPKELAKQAEKETLYIEVGFLLTKAERMTITEMQNGSEVLHELSNQKISHILADMIEVGNVIRIKEKDKTYFALAPAPTTDEA